MPSQQQTYKSKRIASNTLMLFARMLVITIINLYSVRFLLKGLGTEDYGIFNTIAGVVTTTTFVSAVLSMAIQRFYSISLGLQDKNQLRSIFSASLNIIVSTCAIILLFLETAGLWFFYTQLNLPAERILAAFWVYQLAIFSLICTFLQIPYISAVFAHEDMNIYAFVSTLECLLRFISAFLIVFMTYDHLVFYSAGLLAASFAILSLYVFVGRKKYAECHYYRIISKDTYKQLLSFSGWTMFGSIAGIGMIQGNTILLNIFWGAIPVAAFGIAIQIYNAFNSLCNSLVLAFRPQMIKSYAQNDHQYLNRLFSACNKSLFYILAVVAIPLFIEMDTILDLWLGNSDTIFTLFCRLMIVFIVLLSLNNPITIIIQASGHIKAYHLPVESITLCCVPLTWFLFKTGNPPHFVFFAMIGICFLVHAVRLLCLHRFYKPFSIKNYLYCFCIPAFLISMVTFFVCYAIRLQINQGIWRLLFMMVTSALVIILLVYIVNLDKEERSLLTNLLKSACMKVKRKKFHSKNDISK